jgi:hypothetical protein
MASLQRHKVRVRGACMHPPCNCWMGCPCPRSPPGSAPTPERPTALSAAAAAAADHTHVSFVTVPHSTTARADGWSPRTCIGGSFIRWPFEVPNPENRIALPNSGLFGWLVADSWCWFVLREEYCWLVAGQPISGEENGAIGTARRPDSTKKEPRARLPVSLLICNHQIWRISCQFTPWDDPEPPPADDIPAVRIRAPPRDTSVDEGGGSRLARTMTTTWALSGRACARRIMTNTAIRRQPTRARKQERTPGRKVAG